MPLTLAICLQDNNWDNNKLPLNETFPHLTTYLTADLQKDYHWTQLEKGMKIVCSVWCPKYDRSAGHSGLHPYQTPLFE